jgi:hypothetical protein
MAGAYRILGWTDKRPGPIVALLVMHQFWPLEYFRGEMTEATRARR